MPLGEKMEKPEEEPVGLVMSQVEKEQDIPMYLVSPQLLVTREHIISAKASSSFSPSVVSLGSGDAVPLLGLGKAGCTGVPCVVEWPV